MAFADMKRDRAKQLEALTSKLTANPNQQQSDDTYWKPTLDPAGNGSAIIRFLPAAPGDEDPYVQIFAHAFQTPFGWYIEKSLSTIGQPDPVMQLNQKLWAEGDKDTARKQKRNLKYHSNIYVIKDPGNPDNEGKVFKYAYGKKIFDMQKECMAPTDEDEVKFNPFDMWEGANFRLRITQTKGADGKTYPNYDKSKFDQPSPLFTTASGEPDEEKMEAVWNMQYSLSDLIAPSQFKTYEELQTRLNRVLGNSQTGTSVRDAGRRETDESPFEGSSVFEETQSSESNKEDEEDDDLAWFKNLNQDD